MINFTGTYTDQYELTMAQTYFMNGQKDNPAVFDYFFRKLPFNGGYAVFAGLETLLEAIGSLRFHDDELIYLESLGFNREFINYLRDFRFEGNIYSSAEGDIIFPVRPVLQVEASIIEAQLIETLLLNILNFQTLVATKASRMRRVAGNKMLIEFGLRRAQGPGGYFVSRASVVGGFDATSNVRAGLDFGIPVSGTMAHSFIQSYDDELSAFLDFARCNPDNCILLVDTYNTLKSGVPNAIKTGLKMAEEGHKLLGIRLDSGDLAYLSKESRRMLDEAGLKDVKITLSNQLDEYVIRSLLEQQASVDSFGVGTSLSAGQPDGALDGVYKMAFGNGKPRIKLSENIIKITLPHRKQVFRIRDWHGNLSGADVVTIKDEQDVIMMHHPSDPLKSMPLTDCRMEPLLDKVMDRGKRLYPAKTLAELKEYSSQRLGELPAEFKRFENPHVYKIGISDRLKRERDLLIENYKK